MLKAVAVIVAVLASVPWQGVAFTDHTVTRVVPLGNTGIVMTQQRRIPICIHMDWMLHRSMRPASGVLVAQRSSPRSAE